jgi:hypothetical protein
MTESTMNLDEFQRLLWGFAGHRVITVAGRTGILRLLAERDCTPTEIASKLDLDELAAGKVVRALTALGIVETEGKHYRAAQGLREHFLPGDRDIVPFLEHSHAMYESWGATLEPWLRGQAWPVAERTPEEVRRFGAAMRAMGAQMARRVADVLDLEGVERMLDVGGGWGHFAQAVCRVQPGLRATVLDRPEVVERGRTEIAGTEFGERISFLPGDYLATDFGAGYDLVLFANILHQETADRAQELVRRGATALAPEGRVTVVDFAIDDEQQQHLLGALFAINMRSFGDTWTEADIRGWMAEADLDEGERINLGPDRWIISGRKPRR